MIYSREATKRIAGKASDEIQRILAGTVEGGLELDVKVRVSLHVAWWALEVALATLEATEPGGDIDAVDRTKERLVAALRAMRVRGP